MRKIQVIYIHGGDSFDTDEQFYDFLQSCSFDPYAPEMMTWRKWLQIELEPTHDFIYMAMPNKYNADYRAWEIWFNKLIPYLYDEIILIGYSLGGGFLLRYLSEHTLPVSVKQLHLVAGVVDDKDCEGVGGFKIDLTTWQGLAVDVKTAHVWRSEDDPLVPPHHSERLVAAWPKATLHTFADRGQFFQSEFPELLAEIRI